MRLIQYRNHRTAATLKGGAVSDSEILTIKPERPHCPPAIEQGDILSFVADPGQQYIVIDTDHTGMALRAALQHIDVTVRKVTGQATVRRQASTVDDFGRPTDNLEEILIDAPACLVDSKVVHVDPSPAGQQLVIRHELLIHATVPLRQGDELQYTAGGTAITWRIVGAWPVATDTWQIYAVD